MFETYNTRIITTFASHSAQHVQSMRYVHQSITRQKISIIMKHTIPLLFSVTIVAGTSVTYTGPTDQAGVDFIKHFEGFSPNFYTDPAGIKTIGYGHACHAWNCTVPLNGKYPVPLTKANGEALLKEDLSWPGRYEGCIENFVTYGDLTENQYSALVSFTFNLGCGNLRRSILLKKLNAGDVQGAADEFKKWDKAGGKVLPGLVRRRAAENKMFCRGGVCTSYADGQAHLHLGSQCKGVIIASTLNIRSRPSTSAPIVGALSRGHEIIISSRASGVGSNVRGNPYWFKIANNTNNQYVSAFYVNISKSNGHSWCAKN